MRIGNYGRSLTRPILIILFAASCELRFPIKNIENFKNSIAVFQSRLFITLTAAIDIKTYFDDEKSPLVLEYRVLSGKKLSESHYCLFFIPPSKKSVNYQGRLKLTKISPRDYCDSSKNNIGEWVLPHIRQFSGTIRKPSQIIFYGYVKDIKISRGEKIEWIFPLYNIPLDKILNNQNQNKNLESEGLVHHESYQDLTHKSGLMILGLDDSY